MIRPNKLEREYRIASLLEATRAANSAAGPHAAAFVENSTIKEWRQEFGQDTSEVDAARRSNRDALATIAATLLAGCNVHDLNKADYDAAMDAAAEILRRADAVT